MRAIASLTSWALFLPLLLLGGCTPEPPPAGEKPRDYREDMRDLVVRIGDYARERKPGFLVVPQNGLQLLTEDGDPRGGVVSRYAEAIDGVGQESLFFGYGGMDRPTPEPVRRRLDRLAATAQESGLFVLVTDYCRDREKVERSYRLNEKRGYIGFAASSRDLDRIPAHPARPFRYHCRPLSSPAEAENFLYLLNMGSYSTRNVFVNSMRETQFDIVVTDPFFHGDVPFSRRQVEALRRKACGENRFVLAYMSIGEAEDYRPYWRSSWKASPPAWLDEENPDWPGNFKVKYWRRDWQHILMGREDAVLDWILDAGFDGVYLDIIDAFEHFEAKLKEE